MFSKLTIIVLVALVGRLLAQDGAHHFPCVPCRKYQNYLLAIGYSVNGYSQIVVVFDEGGERCFPVDCESAILKNSNGCVLIYVNTFRFTNIWQLKCE